MEDSGKKPNSKAGLVRLLCVVGFFCITTVGCLFQDGSLVQWVFQSDNFTLKDDSPSNQSSPESGDQTSVVDLPSIQNDSSTTNTNDKQSATNPYTIPSLTESPQWNPKTVQEADSEFQAGSESQIGQTLQTTPLSSDLSQQDPLQSGSQQSASRDKNSKTGSMTQQEADQINKNLSRQAIGELTEQKEGTQQDDGSNLQGSVNQRSPNQNPANQGLVESLPSIYPISGKPSLPNFSQSSVIPLNPKTGIESATHPFSDSPPLQTITPKLPKFESTTEPSTDSGSGSSIKSGDRSESSRNSNPSGNSIFRPIDSTKPSEKSSAFAAKENNTDNLTLPLVETTGPTLNGKENGHGSDSLSGVKSIQGNPPNQGDADSQFDSNQLKLPDFGPDANVAQQEKERSIQQGTPLPNRSQYQAADTNPNSSADKVNPYSNKPLISKPVDATPLTKTPQQHQPAIQQTAQNKTPTQAVMPNKQQVADLAPIDWWKFKAAISQRNQAVSRPIGLTDLVTSALENSPRIQLIKVTPVIARQDIIDAESIFDPRLLTESYYQDSVDPVGNTLTTGGAPFLEDNNWTATMGIQRKLRNGTETRLYQTLGFKNSNSTFFTPQDQGTATVGIDFTMPVLRDAGREVNRAPVLIARYSSNIAWSEYKIDLQKELYEIATIYWTLYNSRIQVLLRQESLERSQKILQKLKGRTDYDASLAQIAQAKAEVSLRNSELQEALLSVRDQETLLRERVGRPEFRTLFDVEMIPKDVPSDWYEAPNRDLNSWIELALSQRQELKRDTGKRQVAEQQVVLGKTGLSPKLDLIVGVSASALEGDSGIGQAFTKQFGSTTPGFRVGIDYELPFGRRSGQAQLTKARLQHQQRLQAIEIQKNAIVSEVSQAYNALAVAEKNYQAAYQATVDTRKSVQQNQQQWQEHAFLEGGAGQGSAASAVLDRLLASQRRLTESETRLAAAELNRVLARLKIAFASGTLFHSVGGSTSQFHSFN